MVRILIVDDEPSTRAALRMRLSLESDIVVVGEATDGETAVSAADELAPLPVDEDAGRLRVGAGVRQRRPPSTLSAPMGRRGWGEVGHTQKAVRRRAIIARRLRRDAADAERTF